VPVFLAHPVYGDAAASDKQLVFFRAVSFDERVNVNTDDNNSWLHRHALSDEIIPHV